MLKGIDPRLGSEVLYILDAMGHGDTLMLVDTNYPAESTAAGTVYGSLARMDNLSLTEAAEAVLSVFPVDTFVDDFAATMQVVGDADAVPEVVAECQTVLDRAEGRSRPIPTVDRFAFYDMAERAFAIIRTGETRLYGNLMLRKGVVTQAEG